jgi:hypothetical protein
VADNSVGNTTAKKGNTGQFERQGQTAGAYGNDPSVGEKNGAGNRNKDLKP